MHACAGTCLILRKNHTDEHSMANKNNAGMQGAAPVQ